MPDVQLCKDVDSTIDAYRRFAARQHGVGWILIDADCSAEKLETSSVVKKLDQNEREQTYFMIQEMEAWFLAQPEVIVQQASYAAIRAKLEKAISEKLKKANLDPSQVSSPASWLNKTIKKLGVTKGYQKVKDAVLMINALDAARLKQSDPEFARLCDILKSQT